MARVTPYERQVQLRQANQQEVRVSTSADTFGAGVGRAAQNVAEGVYKVADAIDYRDQLTADADARAAYDRYRYDQREAMSAPETGYLNRTGGNATGVQKTAEEQLRELRMRHGDGLSARARKKYDEMVDTLQDQAHANLLSHTSGEARNYIVNQRQSTIEGYVEEAATNWHNPELFEQNLALAMKEQSELATLEGWDAATQKQSAEKLVSTAFRQRIVLMADADPIKAEELLNNSRDVLSAEDEYALDSNLEGLVRAEKANRFTQQYVHRGPALPGGVRSGQRETARYDAQDRPDDGVKVDFQMGPSRPERPNQEVVDLVAGAARATFGDGVRVVVTSGAEGHREQHGSGRHQTGMAADIAVYRPDGTRVKASDPDAAQFARAAAMSGALGIGFGEGYMGGEHMHVDMVMPGGGQAHTWGYRGKAMRDELTALMDRGAAQVLKNSPYEDSTINRGLVSQFGAEAATTMIGAATNTPYIPAEIALPPEVMAANPNFAGMTVGEVYDTVASAMGDDPVARGGRARFDAQTAYEDALAIEDPRLRAEVMSSIDTLASLQDKARGEERRTAQEQAWNEYTATGRVDFPLAVRQAMGQSGWVSFQEAVKRDQTGIDVSDPNTWEMLTRMASSEPQKFAKLNLSAHYASLSQADRQRFIVAQEAVKSDLSGAQRREEDARATMNFDKAFTAADEVYAAMVDQKPASKMTQEDRQKRLNFQQNLSRMMEDFFDKEKREPSTTEVREMATVLALPIEYYGPGVGWFGQKQGQFFEASGRDADVNFRVAVDYDDIPLADKTRIATQLALAKGVPPTPEEITEAYEQQRLMSVGLPPVIEISAVPEWLIEIEKGDNPDVTDDELIERYMLYIMSQ